MSTCTPTQQQKVTQTSSTVQPRYQVNKEKDVYSVQVQLPGVKKENVEIQLTEDTLTLNAKRSSSVPETWKPLHRELVEKDYSLRLKVNVPVDETKLTAVLENAILTIQLPVKEAAKPRSITIS